LSRCIPFFLTTEDMPDPQNRVQVAADGTLRVDYHFNNTEPLRELRAVAKAAFKRAGYRVFCTKVPTDGSVGMPSGDGHCVGTVRFGTDPAAAVLDNYCRTHDVDNLYVVDASFFPSAGAMNPSLTIMAQALRTADHMLGNMSSVPEVR
jgi:choline dehydrogenase-like flavoprotein